MLRILLVQFLLLFGAFGATLQDGKNYLNPIEKELSVGAPKLKKVLLLLEKAGAKVESRRHRIFVSFSPLIGKKTSVVFDNPHGAQLDKGQAATWVIQLKKITKYAGI